MTREQEYAVERLALQYGRVAVRDGIYFPFASVRVSTPDGPEFNVTEDGDTTRIGLSFSIDWSQ